MRRLTHAVLALAGLAFLHGAGPARAAAPAAAVEAAYAGDFADARELARGDSAAEKLVEWVYLRNNWKEAGYERIAAFLEQNPHWPLQTTLKRRAEQSLLHANESPAQIEAHFANGRRPETADGMLALARAAKARGDTAAARDWAGKAWRIADASAEGRILDEFGKLIRPEDHRDRLWRLIYAQEADAAIRTARRLPPEFQRAAAAAKQLFAMKPGAARAFKALPAQMREQLAMRYALARYYRKQNMNTEAAAILLAMPSDHRKLVDPEQVWIERRLVARDLLSHATRSQWPTAYKLALGHGYADGPFAVEGEFLAGWIALRYTRQPATALEHFNRLDQIVTTRTDKARSQYWLGRTYEAMARKDKAQAAYKSAARFETVYYGQLAREKLGLAERPIAIDDVKPSAAIQRRVEADELVRAFKLVSAAGKDAELGLFLQALSNRFESPQEMAAVASVAWDAGGPHLAVKLAKVAATRGNDIDNWGYPTKAMPDWRKVGPDVEKALVYGLARQESEFNPVAGSGAGARGLMQIMPGTAKLIAKEFGLPYKPDKLTGDPSYNVMLGAAHLGDLVQEFQGSYVLTLVAYNAGPGRAVDWIEQFGDPRSGTVDPIDWVENVPFAETRGYIQKVLQNVQVYRSRLAPRTMQALSADLARGKAGAVNLARSGDEGTASCGEDAKDIANLITGCQ